MASEGPLSAGTLANDATTGVFAWSNASNAGASDNSYATCDVSSMSESQYLKATNFGFAIPTGATIDGILVEWERKVSPLEAYDVEVRLVIGGSIVGDNLSTGALWPTSDTYASFGGASTLWGLTPTYSEINASNFGSVLRASSAEGDPQTLEVDHVRVTVTYTEAVPGAMAAFQSQSRRVRALRRM